MKDRNQMLTGTAFLDDVLISLFDREFAFIVSLTTGLDVVDVEPAVFSFSQTAFTLDFCAEIL